jgi:FKBP-type peptidyl-prolyl cis-trans isomerase 2
MADYKTIEGRALQENDLAVVTYEGSLDGKPLVDLLPNAKHLAKNEKFWVMIKDDAFLPGFAKQLVGAGSGEQRKVSVTFPADFPQEDLRGKEADYDVKVEEIKETVLPEFNDVFAQQIAKTTAEELKRRITENLKLQKEQQARNDHVKQIFEHLGAKANFDLPESSVQDQTRNLIYDIVRENELRGVPGNVLEEKKRSIVHPGQAGAETPGKTAFLVLPLDFRLLLLPVDAEGRVGEEIIECGVGKLIIGEGVSEADVVTAAVLVHLFHEHVRCRGGVGAFVVILTVDVEPGCRMVFAQVALRFGQHAAGAAGRVEKFTDRSGSGQQLVIMDEQVVDHEANHFTGGEMVPGGFVGQFVEPADEVFKDQPHGLVGHLVGMEIHLTDLGHDQVEDIRLPHLLDFRLELEILEDRADILGKALDIADKMIVDVVRVALEFLKGKRRMVVKPLAGSVVQDLVESVVAELAAFAPLIFGHDLFFG